ASNVFQRRFTTCGARRKSDVRTRFRSSSRGSGAPSSLKGSCAHCVRLFDARFIFPDDSFQMKRTSLLGLALSATTLAACDGLSEAFSAHTDVVAKAGPNELSVTRLGELLGKAKLGLPVNKEVATLIT